MAHSNSSELLAAHHTLIVMAESGGAPDVRVAQVPAGRFLRQLRDQLHRGQQRIQLSLSFSIVALFDLVHAFNAVITWKDAPQSYNSSKPAVTSGCRTTCCTTRLGGGGSRRCSRGARWYATGVNGVCQDPMLLEMAMKSVAETTSENGLLN